MAFDKNYPPELQAKLAQVGITDQSQIGFTSLVDTPVTPIQNEGNIVGYYATDPSGNQVPVDASQIQMKNGQPIYQFDTGQQRPINKQTGAEIPGAFSIDTGNNLIRNYSLKPDASGNPSVTMGMNQWTGGGGFGSFLKDAAKMAAAYYGGQALGGAGLFGGGTDLATLNEGWGGAGGLGSGSSGILEGAGGAISSPIASSAGDVIANPLDTTIPGEKFNPDFAKSVSEAPVITQPNTATAAIDTSIETVPSNPPVENVPPPETGVPTTETPVTTEAPTTPSTTTTGTPATDVGGNVLPKITSGIPLVDKLATNIAVGAITKAVMPGNTSTTGTSTTGTTPGASDVGALIGGLLSGASNYSASNTVSEANKNAAAGSQFRPVGITNTFGTSNFTINPTTGELTSAGVTMTPEMIAMQNALKTASGSSLTDLTNIQNLARGYISQTPEQAAASWMAKQNALLAPSQETETARLLNQLQQGGRTGVSVAQGPGMLSANPEYNALMNARTMAQLKLAADATQQGQNQTLFGVNLLSDAYKPLNTNLSTSTAFNTAAMSPMAASTDLAKTVGATNLGAANLLKASQSATPGADFLSSLSKNPLFQSSAGQAFLKSDMGKKILTYLSEGTGKGLDLGGGISIDASGNIVGGTDISKSTPGTGSGDWQQDETGNWYEA
jgi:hypothetical protein